MPKRKSVVMKREIKRILLSSDREDIFGKNRQKLSEWLIRRRRISLSGEKIGWGEKRNKIKIPSFIPRYFWDWHIRWRGKAEKGKNEYRHDFCSFNPLTTLKWFDCPFNPYWKILGNSSRKFCRISIFRGPDRIFVFEFQTEFCTWVLLRHFAFQMDQVYIFSFFFSYLIWIVFDQP